MIFIRLQLRIFLILFISTFCYSCATIPSLISAEYNCDINNVKKLIREGNNVNLQGGSWHETALNAASRQGHIEVVRVLLDSGADPNIRNHYGRTALMLAAKYGYINIARYLIQPDAIVDTIPEDDTGWNALIVASGGREY